MTDESTQIDMELLEELESDEDTGNERDEEDKIRRPKDLNDFISSKNFLASIQPPANKSPGEVFLMLLKFCSANKLSIRKLRSLIQAINNIFSYPILPETDYF